MFLLIPDFLIDQEVRQLSSMAAHSCWKRNSAITKSSCRQVVPWFTQHGFIIT